MTKICTLSDLHRTLPNIEPYDLDDTIRQQY